MIPYVQDIEAVTETERLAIEAFEIGRLIMRLAPHTRKALWALVLAMSEAEALARLVGAAGDIQH